MKFSSSGCWEKTSVAKCATPGLMRRSAIGMFMTAATSQDQQRFRRLGRKPCFGNPRPPLSGGWLIPQRSCGLGVCSDLSNGDTITSPRPANPSTERVRRYRERRREGVRCLTVEMYEADIAESTSRGLLKSDGDAWNVLDAWYASHLSDLALQWLVVGRVVGHRDRQGAAGHVIPSTLGTTGIRSSPPGAVEQTRLVRVSGAPTDVACRVDRCAPLVRAVRPVSAFAALRAARRL